MKNLKIKTRLIVSYAVLIILATLITAVGIFGLSKSATQLEDFISGPFAANRALSNCRIETNVAARNIRDMLINPDVTTYPQYKQNVEKSINAIYENLELFNAAYTENDGLKEEYKAALDAWTTVGKEIMNEVDKGNDDLAGQMLINQCTPALNNLVAIAGKIQTNTSAMETSALDASKKSTNTTTIELFIFLGVAIVLSIVLALYVTKSIIRPLAEMDEVAHKMSQGNLKVSLDYQSKDELGGVAHSMREMIATLDSYITDIKRAMAELADGDLAIAPNVEFKGDFIEMATSIITAVNAFNTTLQQISTSAEQVTSGSEQVSAGAQALSQGATEQASSIQELAATINEISTQVKENATNAHDANEKVATVGAEVMESNKKMSEMIMAMDNISKSSTEIGKIIKTIEDIAFQTNLLALNAAVEAARAGSAGKGFAVVADEVRNLASKSAAASKDTSALIETSLIAVKNGVNLADEAARSLELVVQGAGEVQETIQKISEASVQQSDAINQITVGIDQISAVVQTNSATAEQSAAASEELSGLAHMLKNLVGEFNLKPIDGFAPRQSHGKSAHSSHDDFDFGSGNSKY